MKVIVKKFPADMQRITLYPIADVHLGSKECMEREFANHLKAIAADETARVVLVGDLLNNGIKSSVTNVYDEVYTPREQKHRMIDLLRPVKDKIVCAVGGNHERRIVRETSVDVTEDMCRELGLEEVYAGDMGVLKITLGKDSHSKPITYSFCITHGSGGGQLLGSAVNKPDAFQMAIDGVDGIISGHTHKPLKVPSGRMIFDPRNNMVLGTKTLIFVCTAWLGMGGYPEQKLMRPVAFNPDTITLDGTKKERR